MKNESFQCYQQKVEGVMDESNVKRRDSNMELMRITAMFLVLLFHADYFGIAEESMQTYSSLQWFGYSELRAVSCPCVNMFVLISGWYGIRFCLRKMAALVFQVLFFSIPAYLLAVAFCNVSLSLSTLLHLLTLGGYWFVECYIFLCVLSPILNAFAEHADKSTFRLTLILLFLLTFWYGWIEDTNYIDKGYTPIFFINLYLLARFIRIYMPFEKFTLRRSAFSFVAILIVMGVTSAIMKTHGYNAERIFWNTSPFCLALAVIALVSFSRIHLSSRIVNVLGTSAFAVYLLHAHPFVYEHCFYPLAHDLFTNHDGVMVLPMTLVLSIAIYIVAVCIDQIRILLWNCIQKKTIKQTS